MILKKKVRARACGCCEYCLSQESFSPDSFSLEHIIPLSKKGKTILKNLAFSCQGCNNKKYTATEWVDPLTGHAAPLYNPRKDKWHGHFRWTKDALYIVGLTPTGRATVEKMQINRENVVNLRRVLILSELHPPLIF